jgi:uncharacterized phage protein (TIGR02218 family)
MLPSAVRRGVDLEPESLDVRGALSSDAIAAADLDAGRWDGAALMLILTEWTDPGALWLELARGEIGAVERAGEGFTAELVGPAAVLDRPVAPETSPDCRAMLGDPACRVDMGKYRQVAAVAGVEGQVVTIAGGGLLANAYAFGSLRWLTGANCGIVQAVMASDDAAVTLSDPPAFAVAAGALVLLIQGCDKRMETCSARFGNGVNFRGEPYLPGNDLLTRYPGG